MPFSARSFALSFLRADHAKQIFAALLPGTIDDGVNSAVVEEHPVADGQLVQRRRKRAGDHAGPLDPTLAIPTRWPARGVAPGQNESIAYPDVDGCPCSVADLEGHVADVLAAPVEVSPHLLQDVGAVLPEAYDLVALDLADLQPAMLISGVTKAQLVSRAQHRERLVGHDQEGPRVCQRRRRSTVNPDLRGICHPAELVFGGLPGRDPAHASDRTGAYLGAREIHQHAAILACLCACLAQGSDGLGPLRLPLVGAVDPKHVHPHAEHLHHPSAVSHLCGGRRDHDVDVASVGLRAESVTSVLVQVVVGSLP